MYVHECVNMRFYLYALNEFISVMLEECESMELGFPFRSLIRMIGYLIFDITVSLLISKIM